MNHSSVGILNDDHIKKGFNINEDNDILILKLHILHKNGTPSLMMILTNYIGEELQSLFDKTFSPSFISCLKFGTTQFVTSLQHNASPSTIISK